MEIQQHFVTFYSPGTFVAEQTAKPIDEWDVDQAVAMAADITERYGARPYGFRFSTRGREATDLDSKVIATGPMHYIGGKVETIEEVFARNDPKEDILRTNMDINGHKRIWTSTEGWRWTQPLHDDDIVIAARARQPTLSRRAETRSKARCGARVARCRRQTPKPSRGTDHG